jgi:hypothetical protein
LTSSTRGIGGINRLQGLANPSTGALSTITTTQKDRLASDVMLKEEISLGRPREEGLPRLAMNEKELSQKIRDYLNTTSIDMHFKFIDSFCDIADEKNKVYIEVKPDHFAPAQLLHAIAR